MLGAILVGRQQPCGVPVGPINDLAVDPVNGNVLYMAHGRNCVFGCIADSGGIARSTDRGAHWTALFKGVHMEQVLVDPFDSATIYATGYPASRRSENSGQTWTERGSGLPPGRAVALGANPDHVLYGARNRLYVSADGGRFWRSLTVELPEIRDVAWG